MKIKQIEGMPQQGGYYFAKREGQHYWSCLIRISGQAPFLKVLNETSLFKTGDSVKDSLSDCVFSERLELSEND